MKRFLDTVVSQYGNSPTLLQLIDFMNQDVDPSTDFDAFYDYVWNVMTAQGFGLDIWGKIVNISRQLNVPGTQTNLGFAEGPTGQPFGQAPFYVGPATSTVFTLSDTAYRTLILVKALSNISDCTAQSLNRLLQMLFAGRGRTYVVDTGQMQMRYVFEFALQPFELAILTQSGAVARPAAVLAQVITVDIPTTFGFAEGGIYEPFGQGVFFNANNLVNAA